jgi:putative IMPACT (imprinted ancient) family translation regulator
LGQLQSHDLTNVLIGVVRYYGGTKLGVGGLIHAYRTGALEAIQAGEIIEKEISSVITLRFSMNEMPFIMNAIKAMQLEIKNQTFESDCTLNIDLPLRLRSSFEERMSPFSSLIIEA